MRFLLLLFEFDLDVVVVDEDNDDDWLSLLLVEATIANHVETDEYDALEDRS
jgi:hypothetical protein